MGKNFHKSKHGNSHTKDHRNRQKIHKGKWKREPYSKDNETIRPKPPNKDKVTLKEGEAGITEYISGGKGFTGVLKARYSDFHVNEIDSDGTVLHLTDFTVPKPTDPDIDLENTEEEDVKKELSDVVTEQLWEKIQLIAKDKQAESVEIDVTNLDKDKRTAIHKAIKRLHGSRCNSTTVTKDEDKKFIVVARHDNVSKRGYQWTYPGQFVHFLVYKENMETAEVAEILASGLRMRPSQINYCGTKDKRGKTTQKFCVKNRQPAQIVKCVRHLGNVKIGNFSFHKSVIKLGELKGNRFRIALRHITGDRDEIESSLTSVKEKGFINYYGLQRFGNCASVPTYKVGIALLKSDYKTACELILKPRENDMPFMQNIREEWWKTRDSTAAAAMFHGDKFIEKKLLDGLAQFGESNYLNALRKISRNVLLLYTHSYQSFVFNLVASKRIKEHGLKLIVGDLVYRNQEEADEPPLEIADDPCPQDQSVDDSPIEPNPKEETSSYKLKVKPLTEEDISSGKYTIYDIVLPLPGYDITYPPNEVGKWYEDILAQEDLKSEKLKHCVQPFSLAGAYRKLVIKPHDMSWYFRKYNSPEEDVIRSHLPAENEDKAEGVGDFTALVLDFCLPASSYATMFLREILKSDTSSTSQAQIERVEMKKFEEKAGASQSDEQTAEKRHLAGDEEVETKKVKDDADQV